MCFSATASFVTGAILIPAGLYSLYWARKRTRQYQLFAGYPVCFGIQQWFEGMLWLSLGSQAGLSYSSAYGFMFFSHFFWLWWVPLSAWWLESQGVRKNILLSLSLIGGMYGAFMYFPVVLNDGWLQVKVVQYSVVYDARLIYDGFVSREIVRAFYALIIVAALFISSSRYVRNFAWLILASVILAKIFFDYAFISIWCFYAAILSIYIVFMIYVESRKRQAVAY